VGADGEVPHTRLEVAASGLRRQHEALEPDLSAAFLRVLRAGSFYPAGEVAAFESELAAWLGVQHVVGVASGSAAISLALRALGIGRGDEVICTSNVDIAVGSPLEQTGARMVLVDIDPRTHQLDPADLERRVTSRTRAVLVVHAYGFPADVDRVLAVTAGADVTVIEDLSVAPGARLGGRRVGGLADVAVGSLAPSKPLGALGQAGFVATSSAEVAEEVRTLANYGFEPDSLRDIQAMRPGARFRYRRAGYNGMMDELLAAGLRIKLTRLDGWVRARRERYDAYQRGLDGIDPEQLALPVVVPRGTPSPRLLPIRVPGDRDALVDHLARRGVPATLQYVPPLHHQRLYRRRRSGALPGTDRAAEQVACLPLYPELTEAEVDHVTGCVRAWLSSR
jgi:dTDP-4-amino-4,6-dideoxygalactose transaminase